MLHWVCFAVTFKIDSSMSIYKDFCVVKILLIGGSPRIRTGSDYVFNFC